MTVSAVNRLVEETVSIGMPIPCRKVKGWREGGKDGGGGRVINTVCVKSSEQINKRRLKLAESFQKEKYILPLCAASVSSEYFTSTKPRRRSVRPLNSHCEKLPSGLFPHGWCLVNQETQHQPQMSELPRD